MEREVAIEPSHDSKKFLLTDLPFEMVQETTHLLPVASDACLAACSRSVATIIGTQSCQHWKFKSLPDKNEFLAYMERDFPQCGHCAILYLVKTQQGFFLQLKSTAQERCSVSDKVLWSHYVLICTISILVLSPKACTCMYNYATV